MLPLLHPRSKNEPAVSNDNIGQRSWICQCCVIACQTPIFPDDDNATNWFPMKKRYSTRTFKLKMPTSLLLPSSETRHNRIWLPYEMATILLCVFSFALEKFTLIARRSMVASIYGDVNTSCQPDESFNR